ncbi:MAG: tRNA-modifying protein YgfZ [Actinomycetota bacterium]|nr:tRNA-modifying protein YgfZ [Actinomycetota bacterium]
MTDTGTHTDTAAEGAPLGVALAAALDGANVVDDLGSPTAGDYGDLDDEYRLLRSDAAVVDRSVGGAVRVVGRDARSFLDSLLSQDLTVLGDGEGAHSLLLQPQGKLTADFRLLQLGAEEFWLDTDVGVGAPLAAGLNRFKIRVQVDVLDISAQHGRITVKGPNAASRVADALDVTIPDHQHAHVGWRGGRVVRADWPSVAGVDVVGPRDIVAEARSVLTAAGVPRAGLLALEALRVENGVPRQGHELDESTIPQEAFLERDAVSFTKGCFLGQELVCRIDTRGHVNRQLRGVVVGDLAGADREPVVGAEIYAGEKAVGRVTTVARTPRLGIVALALLRREVEPPAPVTVEVGDGRVAAEARELPLA